MSSMLFAAAAAAAAAAGPPPPTVTAEQALETAHATYGPPTKPSELCPEGSSDEIVVCAHNVDPATQYVPSDIDNGDPDDGVPRAPDVSGLPSCAGATVCAQHLGRQPRQLYIIDLKAIPEPPPGSDADKIAKGEMPAP